jgi:hypothetical protein
MLVVLGNRPFAFEPVKMAVNNMAIEVERLGNVNSFLARPLSEGPQDSFR